MLIGTAGLRNVRLTLAAVKAAGERRGAVALAGENGRDGYKATLTSRHSPDGKVYLARNRPGGHVVPARSWFNIDNVAYRLSSEVRNGQISASWKNMLDLRTALEPGARGYFGFYVERGATLVTDVSLEQLA